METTPGKAKTAFYELIQSVNESAPNLITEVYKGRVARFLSDNTRIWTSGSLFVPISLAAFVALPQIEELQTRHFLFLGGASTALIWFWLAVAESHRAFQAWSIEWMNDIEGALGLRPEDGSGLPKLGRAAKNHYARTARRAMAILVPILWAAATIWWPR